MSQVYGFAPLSAADATRLILGSMPSKASIRTQQYYGHNRNAFWPIMRALFAWPAALDYPARCAALKAQRVAVWDVLKLCVRSSSLDSDIVESSIVCNDFEAFFTAHPRIQAVYFNGAKAEAVYRKYVVPQLGPAAAALPLQRLPSTSPAHASMGFEAKVARAARGATSVVVLRPRSCRRRRLP